MGWYDVEATDRAQVHFRGHIGYIIDELKPGCCMEAQGRAIYASAALLKIRLGLKAFIMNCRIMKICLEPDAECARAMTCEIKAH